jgi:hypothetical protein
MNLQNKENIHNNYNRERKINATLPKDHIDFIIVISLIVYFLIYG